MNQSSLSWRLQCTIIALIVLLHSGMFISLFIANLEYDDGRHEALIMVDSEEYLPQPSKTAVDWVAMPQSTPIAPELQKKPLAPLNAMPNLAAAGAMPAQEKQTDTPLEKKIDEAIALAQKLLADDSDAPSPHNPPVEKITRQEKQEEQIEHQIRTGTIIAQQSEKNNPQKTENVPKKNKPEAIALKTEPVGVAEFNHHATQSGSDKKMPSLAQLAQGFVGHLEQAAMAVRSNKNGIATAEQLKQLHFCQKIIECVVNSYKIQRSNAPHIREMSAARILLVLNENGSINSLEVHQSSGNLAIDNFLLEIFRDASSSFPPIPTSFNQKTFMLPVFNIDRLEAFQSSQGWYIDNKNS